MSTFQYSQIRARNVMQAKNALGSVQGKEGGKNLIKGIPEKIINHGLLAAVADSVGNHDEERVWQQIAKHLKDSSIQLVDPNQDVSTVQNILTYLSNNIDSRDLRLITSETMEWLNFARRLI